MPYMLLIYSNEAGLQSASKADVDQMMAAYGAYSEAMQKAGVIVGGNRLRPTASASTVRVATVMAASAVVGSILTIVIQFAWRRRASKNASVSTDAAASSTKTVA